MKKITSLLLVIASLILSVNIVHKQDYSLGEKPVLSVVPDNSIYGDYLASSYAQKQGETKYAIQFIESALAKEPDNKELLNRSYGIFVYNGDFAKAINHASRQIKEDKELLEKNKKAKVNVNAYLLSSVNSFKNKKYAEVVSTLQPIIDPAREPDSHVDGVMLPMIAAWSNVAAGNYPAAFKVIDGITSNYMLSVFSYHRALINDMANKKPVTINGVKYDNVTLAHALIPDIFTEIGRYSMGEKNYEEAVIYFRLADYLGGGDDVKVLLATAFEIEGKFKPAKDVLLTIPETSKIYNDAQIAIALNNFRLKETTQAEKVLNQVATNKDYSYKALLVLAGIKMEDKKYQEAIDILTKALAGVQQETSENGIAYFNLGISYDKLDKWSEAEANLEKALKLQPKNPEFLNYLAYSWIVKNKNVDKAKKMLEAAVINSGGAGHILDSYGWALYSLGEFKKALPFLEQASNQLPYNPVINDHLGDVYWKLGRKKEAEFQWKRALENYRTEYEELNLSKLKYKVKHGMDD